MQLLFRQTSMGSRCDWPPDKRKERAHDVHHCHGASQPLGGSSPTSPSVCSGDFPDSLQNLIGLELLTSQSSGLQYTEATANQNGDFLPNWLYFAKCASCLLCARRTPAAPAALFPATLASSGTL